VIKWGKYINAIEYAKALRRKRLFTGYPKREAWSWNCLVNQTAVPSLSGRERIYSLSGTYCLR